jgi:hypothetical protein
MIALDGALRRLTRLPTNGHVEPTAVLGRVVPFEALDEPARLDGGEGFVERGGLVGVEIVLSPARSSPRRENARPTNP